MECQLKTMAGVASIEAGLDAVEGASRRSDDSAWRIYLSVLADPAASIAVSEVCGLLNAGRS